MEEDKSVTVRPLDELRLALVEAQNALLGAERLERIYIAHAEKQTIKGDEPGYAALKNETERARFLTLGVAHNAEYAECRLTLRKAQHTAARIEAEIAIHDDRRRERQMVQRDRELDLKARELELNAQMLAHREQEEERYKQAEDSVKRLQEMAEHVTGLKAASSPSRRVGKA